MSDHRNREHLPYRKYTAHFSSLRQCIFDVKQIHIFQYLVCNINTIIVDIKIIRKSTINRSATIEIIFKIVSVEDEHVQYFPSYISAHQPLQSSTSYNVKQFFSPPEQAARACYTVFAYSVLKGDIYRSSLIKLQGC